MGNESFFIFFKIFLTAVNKGVAHFLHTSILTLVVVRFVKLKFYLNFTT